MEFFKQSLTIAGGIDAAKTLMLEEAIEAHGDYKVWIESVESHTVYVLVHGSAQGLNQEWSDVLTDFLSKTKLQPKHVDCVTNHQFRYFLAPAGVNRYSSQNAGIAHNLF